MLPPLGRLADDRPRLWGSNTAVRWRTPLFSAQSASLTPTRARRFFFRDSRRPNIGASAARRSGGISPAGELVVDSRARARSRTCTGLVHVPDRPSARARASPSDMRPKIQLSGCAPFPASCHAQELQNAHLSDVLLIRLHRPPRSPTLRATRAPAPAGSAAGWRSRRAVPGAAGGAGAAGS